jgi:hypothetical protein
MHPNYWFYREGEKEYCWKVETGTSVYYTYEMPESIAKEYTALYSSYRFTKVDCNSFCRCEWHEKHKSKVTGLFGEVKLITETLLSADTCSKLSVGKIVVVRETSDSLITRELRKKVP